MRGPSGDALPGADGRAGGFQRIGQQHPLAVGGPDDEIRDARRMILWSDRDLAHPSTHGAGGIAHGCAEQL